MKIQKQLCCMTALISIFLLTSCRFTITKPNEGTWIITKAPEIEKVQWLHQNQWLMVSSRRPSLHSDVQKAEKRREYVGELIVGSDTILSLTTKSFQPKNKPDKEIQKEFLLKVYPVKDQAVLYDKQINLLDLVKEIDPTFEIKHLGLFSPDMNYLSFGIRENSYDDYYLNINEEKIYPRNKMDKKIIDNIQQINQVPPDYHYWVQTNFEKRDMYGNTTLKTSRGSHYETISFMKKSTHPNSLKIEQDYPEIRKSLDSGNDVTINYSKNRPSAETLAQLATPIGKETWQDVTINKSASIDKERHTINSTADFLKWYQH
ncbi:hypothetical protein [Vagococcus silagei]|uniref:Lipoprotein n=1 Tax=Vagococcus silagei TaxID=2508885 RepID=A0A4S3B4R5_9ENTE|nr:hypothetical protein [Vagococcus silagei]THB62124.1 hypothetical protein ESZ54_02645 [Vagococcus silagei]